MRRGQTLRRPPLGLLLSRGTSPCFPSSLSPSPPLGRVHPLHPGGPQFTNQGPSVSQGPAGSQQTRVGAVLTNTFQSALPRPAPPPVSAASTRGPALDPPPSTHPPSCVILAPSLSLAGWDFRPHCLSSCLPDIQEPSTPEVLLRWTT